MWPFNYFKKKREKAGREHLCQKEEAPLHKLNQESIACERVDLAEENHGKTSRKERAEAEFLQPFTFKSNCHQRYENGSPVKGEQECSRTVSVIKNTNGHPSYRLEPGIGYIVKIYNDDLGKPNMSDKPMKVIRKTETFIELRGFPIDAQSPFGWQEVDYSDYGFIVYYKNGQVEKCVLHMYDRNVRIEYYKKEVSYQKEQKIEKDIAPSKVEQSNEITESEMFVMEALLQLSVGNDGDATYHPLFKAWRSFQRDPEQLKKIKDWEKFGMGLMIFLSYGTVSDIDDKQQLASVAYLFLSKAIKKSPQNINLYKNRLILIISNREAFEYTVSSVINKDDGLMFMNSFPFKARDAMFKMEFADLLRDPKLLGINILEHRYLDLKNKISSGFFGPNQDDTTVRNEGNELHQEILEFLENKVIENGDIDF